MKRYGEITKASKEKLECARVYLLDNICRRGMGITDSTKSLSYEEVKRGIARIADTHSKENYFLELFNVIDVDDDGTISFQEWEMHYKCLGIDPAHARASFDALDMNKDGIISKEEFRDYHWEFFCTAENKLNSEILYGPLE